MKKIYKLFTYFVFISLIFINVFIFINGIRLSQKITFYEINTQKLKKENLELEAYLYKINSLQFTSSQAAKLDFSKKADPYFLENLRFALKK